MHKVTQTELRNRFLTQIDLLPLHPKVLNIYLPSTKFIQCQTITRNILKPPPNEDIKILWKSTGTHTNLQYDKYKGTKQLLKAFRSNQEDRLISHLVSQGSFFSAVISYSLPKLDSIWSSTKSNL